MPVDMFCHWQALHGIVSLAVEIFFCDTFTHFVFAGPERVGKLDPIPPEKSQVAIDFYRGTGTDPLENQLDSLYKINDD